jgi:hypothetical protein
MPAAPTEIVDGLESILDIFLSDVRHRERSVFILCDNLVEMACKTKAKQKNHHFNTECGFYDAWNAPGVHLARNGLGSRVHNRRDMRNLMQHASAAATVDTQTCADAIIDILGLLLKLWGRNALDNLREWHKIAIRIVKLYSSGGDPTKREQFEDAMRRGQWRADADEKKPKINEIIVEVGRRGFWSFLVKQAPSQVEQIILSCIG